MRRGRISWLYCLILFFSTFLFVVQKAEAAEALPPGYLVGDDTGFSTGRDGEYFIRNDDVKPGQSFQRTITISNYSNKEGSYTINLVMNPDDKDHTPKVTGEVDLMKAVDVTLTYQGKQIYKGSLDGNGTPIANLKSQPISIGVLETGEVRTIQADFTVSDQYPASAWKKVNTADFYWLFFAHRDQLPAPPSNTSDTSSTTESSTTSSGSSGTESTDTGSATTPSNSSTGSTPSGKPSIIGKLPQTGEDWRNVLLGLIAGVLLISFVLVIAKKRHDQHKE